MKNRIVPFGYGYGDGNLIVHPQESVIVAEIYQDYLSGKSLLDIVKSLNQRNIEYWDGAIGWNKARIKRILEDERYIGKRDFPALVDESKQRLIQDRIAANSLVKEWDPQADIFQISELVKCAHCFNRMRRRHDRRHYGKIKWACDNRDCRFIIPKDDDDLLRDVTQILAETAKNPERLKASDQMATEQSEAPRFNEITELLNSTGIDQDILRKKILESASKSYREIDSAVCKTQKLKDIFARAAPSENFPTELFHRSVKEILLHKDGRIEIVFINNQVISKEREYGGDGNGSPHEKGEGDRADDR